MTWGPPEAGARPKGAISLPAPGPDPAAAEKTRIARRGSTEAPRRRSAEPVGRRTPITEQDELPLVMREIAEAMSAKCVALTLHPADDRKPSIIYAGEAAGIDAEIVDDLIEQDILALVEDEALYRWTTSVWARRIMIF